MALGTLTPEDKDQDEKLNPSQQDFLRDFENRPAVNQDDLDRERAGYTKKGGAEQAADKEKQAVGDTAAGKAAVEAASATASAAASPLAGAAIKFLSKIKISKKGGVGTVIAGILIAAIVLIAGFAGPGLLIVQVKEALMDKFGDVVAAMDDRQTAIIGKKLQDATTAGCKVKVMCRFKGMSASQIDRIKATGIKVEPESGSYNAFKRRTINKLIMPDGTEVTASNYKSVIRSNLAARGYMMRAFNPSYTAYTSKAFDWVSRKLGITKQKRISGDSDSQIRESMENSIAGEDEDGNRIGKSTITEDEKGNFVDENGDPATNPDGTPMTQAQVDELNRASAEFDRVKSNIADTGRKAGISAAKSATLAALTAGVGATDSLCTGYYLIQTVGLGAKVIGSQQLIRFAFTFLNTADAIKAGDATAAEVSYLGDLMTKQNQYGEAFTDSFGYKYAAFDSLSLPTGSTQEETEQRRGEVMQYAVGGGLAGGLLEFTSMLNQYTNNAPAEFCRFIKNPITQVGLLLGGLALTIGSGGTSLGPGTAVAIAASAAVSVVIGLAVPTLQNIVAGEIVNADTFGADAGNAATAGAGALNAQVSQAHGLSPLTVDAAVAYEKKNEETIALNKAAERSIANPLDVTNSSTAAYSIATTLNNYIPHSLSSLLSSPSSILKNSINSAFSNTVSAATDPRDQYQICTDEQYNEGNYAADPFCNIRYGLSEEELALDPETVTAYMYENGHITEDGKPASSEFSGYIETCISRTLPIGGVDENELNDGAECNQAGDSARNNYFRVYYLDTIINDSFDGEDTFGLGGTPSSDSNSDDPSTIDPISGDEQSLAQQILASGKVSGDSRAMQQIQRYAAGDFSCHINIDILRLILRSAQNHTVRISSLNRYCLGILTDSGTSSYHWRSGGGHAVDFNFIDGVHATGTTPTDLAYLREIIPTLPPGSGIGQLTCRSAANALVLPAGFRTFEDTCNHIHIDVPVK